MHSSVIGASLPTRPRPRTTITIALIAASVGHFGKLDKVTSAIRLPHRKTKPFRSRGDGLISPLHSSKPAMASSAEVRIPEWATTVPQDDQPRPGKRSRVALACQRCKTRKQKCNGANPCSKCQSLEVPCEYVVPQKPMPFGKNQYIKSLERRVAELETILAKQGMSDMSKDHWTSLRSEQAGQFADDTADSVTNTPESDLDEPDLDWQDGVDNVVSVLRSLSMDANGTGYIGGSSHVTMGKLFSFLGGRQGRNGSQSRKGIGLMRPLDQTGPDNDDEPIDLGDVPTEIAGRLFTGYLKHIATRFPVVYSVWIRKVHDQRLFLTDIHERTILHLVYASGGRFLETAGEYGAFNPQRHYAAALGNLGAILDYDDIRSVSALMLMAVYCLRNPVGPGAWTYSRMAMLIALNLGLHRKTSAMRRPSMENELRKRIFWATYAFDRQISIPLGRPFAVSDRDIDVPLPLDIDEATTPEEFSRLAEPDVLGSAPENSTSLSSFLQIVRIRQIESDIQQTIYRVDETPEISDAVVEGFLKRLDHWKTLIPLDARKKRDMEAVPFDGYDVYMVYFFKCKRLLLYPQISKTTVNPRFLKECATACAGVCGAYKRLHQAMSVGYSLMALQTVFMAGLTLVYCIWISPDEIFDITTSNGIHDCSIVLFVIAERVRAARKYRNAFEVIRQRVIDQVSDRSSRQPRQAMSGLVDELGPSVHSWDVNQPFEVDHDSFEQFSQIISEMSGGFPEPSDPFSGMNHNNTGGWRLDMPSVQTTTIFAPDAGISPDLVSPAQTFPVDMVELENQNGVYNDGLSPWFRTR
ncbi:putative Zn(2)-C6 fungal-type domain-containing protein [Seiridium cardinale]